MGWGDDERVTHEPPTFWEADVVLYRHDGTPLKRQIGFAVKAIQTTGTNPDLYKSTGKKTGKGGGKKKC